MFDLGMQELIVIFAVALIVFGPKKLPELGRTIGKGINELKRSMAGIKDQFDEEVKGIKDIKEEVEKGVDNLKAESLLEKGPIDFSISEKKEAEIKQEEVKEKDKEKETDG